MIAEFYGLPGCGKTTLEKKLTQDCGNSFRKHRSGKSISAFSYIRNGLTGEFLGFAFRCFRLYLAKKKKWKADGTCVCTMLGLYLMNMWERTHGTDAYRCYDHGIIQCCMSLIWQEYYLRDGALELAGYYLRHMQPTVRLVYMQSGDLEEIYRRMVQRGESRRIIHRMEKNSTMELLRFQSDFFDRVCAVAKEYDMGLQINAMDPVETGAASVCEGLGIQP